MDLVQPLSRSHRLLSLALRHHRDGRVRHLLGTDDSVARLEAAAGEAAAAVAGTMSSYEALQLAEAQFEAETSAHCEARAVARRRLDRDRHRGLLIVDGLPLVGADHEGPLAPHALLQGPASADLFDGTSFTARMLDDLGGFLAHPDRATLVPPPVHQDYVPDSRPLPQVAVRHSTFPKDPDEPARIQMVLMLEPVMHKPQGAASKEAAVAAQGGHCKGCTRPLKRSLNPVRGWDGAVFCFYSGFYYCEACHDRAVAVIPARVIAHWDFTPKPVCTIARDFMEVHRETPAVLLSALNPGLYERVGILGAARALRLELAELWHIGLPCPTFRQLFLEGTGGHLLGQAAAEYDPYVPVSLRYLAADPEFWSLADLCDLRAADPAAGFAAAAADATPARHPLGPYAALSPLITRLLRMRRDLIRHVLKACVDRCLPAAVHVCPGCQRRGGDGLVFSFDKQRTHVCPRCRAAFHKPCWGTITDRQAATGALVVTCPVCHTLEHYGGIPTTAARSALNKQ